MRHKERQRTLPLYEADGTCFVDRYCIYFYFFKYYITSMAIICQKRHRMTSLQQLYLPLNPFSLLYRIYSQSSLPLQRTNWHILRLLGYEDVHPVYL